MGKKKLRAIIIFKTRIRNFENLMVFKNNVLQNQFVIKAVTYVGVSSEREEIQVSSNRDLRR